MRLAQTDPQLLTPKETYKGLFSKDQQPFRTALSPMPNVYCPSLVRMSGAALRGIEAAIRHSAESTLDSDEAAQAKEDVRPTTCCALALTPGETIVKPGQRELSFLTEKFNPELDFICRAVAESLLTVFHQALPQCRPSTTAVGSPTAICKEQANINKQIHSFVRDLANQLCVSPASMLGALVVLDRCVQAGIAFTRSNLWTFFVAALRVASKVVEICVMNERGYPPPEYKLNKRLLNYVEVHILTALHFGVLILPHHISRYAFQIVRRTNGATFSPMYSPRIEPTSPTKTSPSRSASPTTQSGSTSPFNSPTMRKARESSKPKNTLPASEEANSSP